MINSGVFGSALILSTVACSVPVTSGLAGLLKPMWLSLIWTKLKSPFPPCASFPKARELGTPPVMVQMTPVPAQAMQCRNPRRSIPSSLWSCVISFFKVVSIGFSPFTDPYHGFGEVIPGGAEEEHGFEVLRDLSR